MVVDVLTKSLDTNAKLLMFDAVSVTVLDIHQKVIRALDMLHWNFLKTTYINKYYMLAIRLHYSYFRICCLLRVCFLVDDRLLSVQSNATITT